ncbi:MAG: AMP-binding protein [Thermaerobacter sp.]|nr:AMP-binding protein [Thermaerobacter sp.]
MADDSPITAAGRKHEVDPEFNRDLNPELEQLFSGRLAWRPDPKMVRQANLTRFLATWELADLDALRRRAAAHPEWFWDAVVKDIGWHFAKPYDEVLDLSQGAHWPRWFTGGTTNLASTCLDRHATGSLRNRLAVIWEGEEGAVAKLTYRELYQEANRLANAMAARGVGPGTVVGLYLPMIPEAVVATYAVAKLGAAYVPLFSGYGAEALATRLQDSGASWLICADGFHRRGRRVDMKSVADQAVAECPGVERVLVVNRTGKPTPMATGRDHWWHELVADADTTPRTEAVDSEHPFMVIYTSGTSGRPKGAVHVHPGFPLKAAQDLLHCFDLKSSDTLFWFTDMGWMMGPWEVLGGMALGATVLLYDGSPDYPGPDRLWSLVERHGVTVLGISPTAIRGLMAAGTAPVQQHDRTSLRILGSTGEPWTPEAWEWFFQVVGGARCPIINYSGGTEISGGILSGFPTEPSKPCAFGGPVPGMAAVILDEAGNPAPPGTVGELALTAPWPGMTRGFWKDPARYEDTYWSRVPDTWVHGDFAVVDPDGFWYILGRSDDTIKMAGKRLGPAEAEGALAAHSAVREAAAIGVPHPVKGEVLVLFCVLHAGHAWDDRLEAELSATVAGHLGKALKPDRIHAVTELPKTRNGKVVRRALKAAYLGRDPGDVSAIENLGALDAVARLKPDDGARQISLDGGSPVGGGVGG